MQKRIFLSLISFGLSILVWVAFALPGAALSIPTNDDIFLSSDFVETGNLIQEYTPAGQLVRIIAVPANTGSYAQNNTEYLRGIAVSDAGEIMGFNGTFSPQVVTFDPISRTFTSRTSPNWDIGNNGSSGSVGVVQGYAFVLSDNLTGNSSTPAIVRFNPDGTSQQFGAATDFSSEKNLAVSPDGKLYVLYQTTKGTFCVDVYDPISLQLLRTVNLQIPLNYSGLGTDLRNLAIDAAGGIYAIDLSNYVYHFDANGNLLKAASHGYGNYTGDIKIDPVSGRILISVGRYGAVILETDPSLSSFKTLIQLDPNKFYQPFITFGNAKLNVALNTPPHLLWTNTDGRAAVWNLSDPNPATTAALYGPFPGWTAKVITQGPDGNARLLWTNINGTAALWNLADPNPATTCNLYGPYSGWTATALTVGPDNAAHLLWDNTDGRVALWNTADADPAATALFAGPYSGWSGTAISIGANNQERLLWDNVNGMASVWNLADASPVATSLLYGPYSGWTAKRLSVGNDNAAHLLWDNVSGQMSLWNLGDPNPALTCVLVGPYGGWSGQDLSVGSDNQGRLLWDNVSGQNSLWNLADANPAATCTLAGPYSGWTAVSVAAGR